MVSKGKHLTEFFMDSYFPWNFISREDTNESITAGKQLPVIVDDKAKLFNEHHILDYIF